MDQVKRLHAETVKLVEEEDGPGDDEPPPQSILSVPPPLRSTEWSDEEDEDEAALVGDDELASLLGGNWGRVVKGLNLTLVWSKHLMSGYLFLHALMGLSQASVVVRSG